MPYYVYAIRLDRAAMEAQLPRAFKDQNWHIDWDYPLHDGCEFYYVGQTIHTPECRFEQHKHCHSPPFEFRCICRLKKRISKSRSNRFVRRYGLFLQSQMFEHLNPVKTRRASELLEKTLTDELRDQGHCVYFN